MTYKKEGVASLAAQHGICSVPAVLINGKLAGCCAGRGVEEHVLREALWQRVYSRSLDYSSFGSILLLSRELSSNIHDLVIRLKSKRSYNSARIK
jgi:hypothetical protein